MARRRSNARPTRNELRDIRRMRDRAAYGTGAATALADRDPADAGVEEDGGYDPDAAAQAEIAAYLASLED